MSGGKVNQELKQKVTSLSYPLLLERQQEIQTRLSQIGIHNTSDNTNTSNNNSTAPVDLQSSSSLPHNVKHNASVSLSENQGGEGGVSSSSAKRGRRRKRSTNTTASDTVTTAPDTNAVVDGSLTFSKNNATTAIKTSFNDNTNKEINTSTSTTSEEAAIKIPYTPKKDIQWDFLLAEMKWLSADFQSERKRQISLAKKQSNSIIKYTQNKSKKQMQKLIQIEMKKRKLSSKISRDVIKGWWENKIHRIITYKQKVDSELVKKRSMDRHLIQLVKQTEKYSSDLLKDPSSSSSSSIKQQQRQRNNHVDVNHCSIADIEHALSSIPPQKESTIKPTMTTRKRRRRTNYQTINEELNHDNNEYLSKLSEYGAFSGAGAGAGTGGDENSYNGDEHSIAHDNNNDNIDTEEEFVITQYEVDDETTIEAEEQLGRDMSYQEEIDLLQKENEMSIEELKAKYNCLGSSNDNDGSGGENDETDSNDNDDIGNDENNNDSNTSTSDDDDVDEFEPIAGGDIDDETTIEAEEKLGRDMSYEDEIDLLKRENDMSIEQLRALYYGNDGISSSVDDDDQDDNAQNDEENLNTNGEEDSEDTYNEHEDPFSINDDAPQDEFYPEHGENDVDDETTIEAEERLGRDMSYEDEIELLKKESEMSIEDLKKMYLNISDDKRSENNTSSDNNDDDISDATSIVSNRGGVYNNRSRHNDEDGNISDTTSIVSNEYSHNGADDDDEFSPELGNDVDDETTIEAEELLGRDMSYEDELKLLREESEMSVEELRAKYLIPTFNDNRSDIHDQSSRKRKQHCSTNDEYEGDLKNDKKMRLDKEGTSDDADSAIRSLELADAKARNTTVSRPFLLASWVKLRAYQQIGLNWLVSTQTRRLNAILADEMGLGKTLQTISLLSYLACYKGIWGPHLIIVPTSCIVNWELELKRFAPGLKVLCYYGSAKRRKELRQGWTKTNWHHVIITSYQIVVQDSFAFKRKKWYYLILDEAHNIKNFQSQRWQTLINFNTQRRLLLTGTPLQNNLMELWSLLHFLMPYIFRSRKEFSQWFSNPMNNIIEGNTNRNNDLIGRLHGIIRPFVLRRLKKDVETQMPGKFEHIVKCHLSRRQMFLYEEFMARSSTRMALQKGGNYMGMMNVLMQLRKVCNHPDLFEPRSIVTPFFTESLSITTAGCIPSATANRSPFDKISSNLLHPVWSKGCGIPSIDYTMKHDQSITKRLKELKPTEREFLSGYSYPEQHKGYNELKPGLQKFLDRIRDETTYEKERSAEAHMRINSSRCDHHQSLLPASVIALLIVEPKIPKENVYNDLAYTRIAETPSELLAMKRSQEDLENEMSSVLDKFLFYVPRAGAKVPILYSSSSSSREVPDFLVSKEEQEHISRSLANLNAPFFPDKKLVQFDAGKLQILAGLLHSLKQEKHRVLIFTQMSKMLDILEVFLNLNGYTYLRLDGSTGVEQRQKLMDRFNNDERVFCFILSTRSGGLGINLTGADTVVFYDSDWNPAMDAQAQDRAHRIGQTRDVHIYRLVTEHTIEENILVKAKQKRHLDFLVMDEGKFHATVASPSVENKQIKKEYDSAVDVTTKTGLRSILGLDQDNVNDSKAMNVDEKDDEVEMSKEEMESAMAKLEDEDDVLAMRGAQKEAEEELQEFDESVKLQTTGNDEDNKISTLGEDSNPDEATNNASSSAEAEEAKLEKEFAAWQKQVGADKESIDASLNPIERYALRFKEDIDPFYSMYYISELERQQHAALMEEEIDIGEIDAMNAEDEYYAIEEGDLLATRPSINSLSQHRFLYNKEKSRIKANKKRRKLTGENWSTKIDGKTQFPFWYNSDTGEALWDKPKVLVELEEDALAQRLHWNALPKKPLILIMNYLNPYPERMTCALVCRNWRAAAQDISFVRHVYPVEMGALTMNPKKMDKNHYRTISEALEDCLPGDTIELGDGHYWVNDLELYIDHPLRIIGDEKDPSHVVIEVSGSIYWNAANGYIEGVTFRRPRINSNEQRARDVLVIGNNFKSNLVTNQCVIEGNTRSMGMIANGGCAKENSNGHDQPVPFIK